MIWVFLPVWLILPALASAQEPPVSNSAPETGGVSTPAAESPADSGPTLPSNPVSIPPDGSSTLPLIPGSSGEEGDSESSTLSPGSRSKGRNSRGSRVREKETDGTEAANRFQPEGVLKSPYQLNGQPLEVDPD